MSENFLKKIKISDWRDLLVPAVRSGLFIEQFPDDAQYTEALKTSIKLHDFSTDFRVIQTRNMSDIEGDSGPSERFLHEATSKIMHGSNHSSPVGSPKEKSPAASEGEKAPSSTGSIRESRSRSKSRESKKSVSRVSPVRRRSRTRSRSRSRSYHRYRTRSRSRSRGRRRYYSRSRSRSPYHSRRHGRSRHGSDRRRSYRSHSRSPMSGRRRHVGNREAPKTSNCVGVFGLSLYTQERDIRDYFSRFGPIDEVQIVHDHQTGRSRGFGFVYYRNLADACEARERAPGAELDGRKIRVDYSITERAHTPTPGIYLGKPTPRSRGSGGGSGYGDRRSPSPPPYYRSRSSRYYSRSRSRSRSYSPRNEGEE